ncbi:MAG: membrane protein insertion efficiency factor YidD [Gemmatimonadetes bacterium]|nr:MAG: membrane protein insertion efficiency factor YidD [Gemmatimonadota bacterium]
MRVILVGLIICTIIPGSLVAQWQDTPNFETATPTTPPDDDSPVALNRSIQQQTSTPKWVLRLMLRAYQIGLSQHDGNICPFYPSCSRYALAAIEQYGVAQGICMASDRLQRCNGCIWGHYVYSYSHRRFLDPPADHDIFRTPIPSEPRIP